MSGVLFQDEQLTVLPFDRAVHPMQRLHTGTFDGERVLVKAVKAADFDSSEVDLIRSLHGTMYVAKLLAVVRRDATVYMVFEDCALHLDEFLTDMQLAVRGQQTEVVRQMLEIFDFFARRQILLRLADLDYFKLTATGSTKRPYRLKIWGLCCAKRGLVRAVHSKERCKMMVQMQQPGNIQLEAGFAARTLHDQSSDIFAAGSFAYYILAGRQNAPAYSTITRYQFDVFPRRSSYEAFMLVRSMLGDMDNIQRPGFAALLKHPLFWTEKKAYEFFQAIRIEMGLQSDDRSYNNQFKIKETLDAANNLTSALHRDYPVNEQHTNWWTPLSPIERDELRPPPPAFCVGSSLASLIITLRCSYQHQKKTSCFGRGPYAFVTHIRTVYYKFTMEVWMVMKPVANHFNQLKRFY